MIMLTRSSERIFNPMRYTGNIILTNFYIRLGHKPTNTLRTKLCSSKDDRKSQDAYDAMYKISCFDCEQVHVWETI